MWRRRVESRCPTFDVSRYASATAELQESNPGPLAKAGQSISGLKCILRTTFGGVLCFGKNLESVLSLHGVRYWRITGAIVSWNSRGVSQRTAGERTAMDWSSGSLEYRGVAGAILMVVAVNGGWGIVEMVEIARDTC